eukprot:TRINITY_DN3119_c0_g1_i4.p1 TRINITY_DN3119_c0_g1~~TRINITY_DN3119_c0_g1_i4.p1  ORF type:complete len:130 (+),score=56.70 TRINITY_DN3119_c0_g1_i4:82-471(+)
MWFFFFFQAEDGIRDAQESRGLGDVYKRQVSTQSTGRFWSAMEPLTTLPAVREYIKQQLIQLLDLDPDDDDEFPDDDENLNSWDLDSKKAEALRQRLIEATNQDISADALLSDYTMRGFIAAVNLSPPQ